MPRLLRVLLINGNRFHKMGILVYTYPALTMGTVWPNLLKVWENQANYLISYNFCMWCAVYGKESAFSSTLYVGMNTQWDPDSSESSVCWIAQDGLLDGSRVVMRKFDQRKSPRIRQSFRVKLLRQGVDYTLEGTTANLSQKGAFIRTKHYRSF